MVKTAIICQDVAINIYIHIYLPFFFISLSLSCIVFSSNTFHFPLSWMAFFLHLSILLHHFSFYTLICDIHLSQTYSKLKRKSITKRNTLLPNFLLLILLSPLITIKTATNNYSFISLNSLSVSHGHYPPLSIEIVLPDLWFK